MSAPIIEIIPDDPDAAARDRILELLDADNLAKAGRADSSDFAVLIRDPASGDVLGGLWGMDDFGWAFIVYLYVPTALRGQKTGARLIHEAEAIARARGMVGMWVNTFDFQAAGFYEKLGFVQFGALEKVGGAAGQIFLKKQFGD